MALPTEVQFGVRGTTTPDLIPGGEDYQPGINGRLEQLVVQSLPPITELVRLGGSYFAPQTTAVAPITAIPTTTAQLSIWNGETDTGKCYVIDVLQHHATVASAAAWAQGMYCMLNVGRIAKPAGTAITVRGMSGFAYRGKGSAILAATVVDDGWHSVGQIGRAHV